MIRRFVCLSLVLLWPGISPAGPGETESSNVLPTERCGDFYFVQMAFAGDADRILSMLLDTGASHTVIDPDSLERVSGKRIETVLPTPG